MAGRNADDAALDRTDVDCSGERCDWLWSAGCERAGSLDAIVVSIEDGLEVGYRPESRVVHTRPLFTGLLTTTSNLSIGLGAPGG